MSGKGAELLAAKLEELDVAAKYRPLLTELAGGDTEYLGDIVVADLEGRIDADGATIVASAAKSLVEQLCGTVSNLEGSAASCSAASAEPFSRAPDDESKKPPVCAVALSRNSTASSGDKQLVRCALRGSLPSEVAGRRQKVLAVVLDRSGSMAGAQWRRVVEAVVGVITDDLLCDPHVYITFVVYSDDAREIKLPSTAAALRDLLLSRDLSPQGGTCFRAAFERTRQALERELRRIQECHSVEPKDVDLATLVFTDGEDTSVKGRPGRYGVRLVDKEASSAAARTAGDEFRNALAKTGCPSYVCIAAFGADHDPDQCQYLSDRYYYINRGEALTEVLAGGLGALLSSAGQCSVHLQLPKGVCMEEPLPETLPLDAEGSLDHHVWLRMETEHIEGTLVVDVAVAGTTLLHGRAPFDLLEEAPDGSFEEHLFLVDSVALRLRAVARELCGRQPSPEELTSLRARLTDAKEHLQPTKEACSVATGQLRGRAALRERLAEVEALRERLSYALGQFDERDTNDDRKIGTVAIDAILRDAGQHVPQGPTAAALARRTCLLAELPPPEALSEYGKEFTTDAYSCCDAQELAVQSDALFFPLANVRPAARGFVAVDECSGFISHEAFMLLSKSGRQAVKHQDGLVGFTHIGLPLYATAGHFMRAQLLLPDALQRLSLNGIYQSGVSERQLLSILGRSLATASTKSEGLALSLLHKARAVHAVLSGTRDGERTLLQTVVAEADRFVENPALRPETVDLYAIAGVGLLSEGWDSAKLTRLGVGVAEECFRRKLAHGLRGALQAQRLFLAWALLGHPDDDDAWLDRSLPYAEAGELSFQSANFNPFTAHKELEALEDESPGQFVPRSAGVAALLSLLSGKHADNTPVPQDWGVIRHLLPLWGEATKASGGVAALWRSLDALMLEGGDKHQEAVHSMANMLRTPMANKGLRAALGDARRASAVACTACLPDIPTEQSVRRIVASGLREVVEKRAALARAHPISGSAFPQLECHSAESVKEVWGAPANPTDAALHHKAMLRVCRRTMKVRISQTIKEALADKEYRKRGGKFAFPSPMDTFIRGLHRRTSDLHQDWRNRLSKATDGEHARQEAVEEMLLRLRWDDSDDKARAKLKKIVGRIWDDLEGLDLSGVPPISSALWLNDDGDDEASAQLDAGKVAGLKVSAESGACATEPSTKDQIDQPETQGTKGTDEEVTPSLKVAASSGGYPSPSLAGVASGPPGLIAAREVKGTGKGKNNGKGKGKGDMKGKGKGGFEDKGKGKGEAKGKGKGVVMDAGLRESFASLPEDVVRQIERLAADARPGNRLKLPNRLTAKQRKALHLWAEERGLEHRSFGFGHRRRMHLTVPGAPGGGVGAGAALGDDDDFDPAAWQSEEDEEEEEAEEDEEHEPW